MRTIETKIGKIKYSYEGYKGTRTFRHYYFYTNKKELENTKFNYCQVHGKTFKKALEMFNDEIEKGFHKDIFNY